MKRSLYADPIVKEVREAGAKLAAEAGNDIHRFFENLRQAEKKYGKPLVREPLARYKTTRRIRRNDPTRRGHKEPDA